MNKNIDDSGCIIKNSLLKLLGIYLIICVIVILVFWIFPNYIDDIGYSFITFYITLPIASFVLSILIGKDSFIGNIKYFVPIFLGLMYMLCEYLTFSLANMISFSKFNIPDFSMVLIGMIISYIGLGIGILIKSKNNK